MTFFGSFFRSFITSIIVTFIFALIGVSLFVGNFPPTVGQVKNVFNEYKDLLRMKEKILEANSGADTDKLAEMLQNNPQEQMRRIAKARGANAEAASKILADAEGESNKPEAKAVEVQAVDIPKAWQEQFYQLRAEVQRLNQRVVELEKQKVAAANPPRQKK